eukprot:5711343-Alexandrium_andersonii.AAC.1
MKLAQIEHAAGRAALYRCFRGVHRLPHGVAARCPSDVCWDGAPAWGMLRVNGQGVDSRRDRLTR